MHLVTPIWRLAVVVHATVGTLLLLLTDVYAGPPFFFCESFPDPPGRERFQGWGSDTLGSGTSGTVIHVGQAPSGCNPVPPPTEADLIAAIQLANSTPNPTIVFPPNATIWISDGPGPPALTANNATILGNGATIRGDSMDLDSSSGRMFEIRGHDVILRDLHFRNGGNDNLRIQGPDAHRIVISHITSTGAGDDGISISNRCIGFPHRCALESVACDPYLDGSDCPAGTGPCVEGCQPGSDPAAPHDITVQFSFFAGNTRSMFLKSNVPSTSVHRVSVHHNWFLKQWVRGPLVEKSDNVDYVNNVVEDWAEWGLRFDSEAKGNVVYNVFKQAPNAVELGRMVDPKCRVSEEECAYNGAPGPNCPTTPDFCCDYIVGDPLMNNQMKGFNLGDHIAPENVYTNVGTTHTNWYLRRGIKAFDGTAPAPFGVCQLEPRQPCQTGAPCGPGNACELPEVLTMHQYGDLQDELRARTGPCVLTQAQIDAWTAGQEIKCPRHAIDDAYMDAEDWCVNRKHPFRPPGF